jgi:glutamate/tyrosine decarboxylase-like PLP-dependent enzyme
VGGILAPFVRECGFAVPAFDFAIPGVTSVSADLHKSGFAAKPASTVSFRSRALREFARYQFDDWPSGVYSGLTFTGTRPGGAIAAAWAAMNFLGKAGYREIAAATMRAKERTIAGLTAIEGVKVHGEPPLYAFSWAAAGADMAAVAAGMGKRGFLCGQTTSPAGIHFMATPVHEQAADAYAEAAAHSIEEARAGAKGTAAAYN